MVLYRSYVPSIAVLRLLSRPYPSSCEVARRLPIQCLRGKRTKSKTQWFDKVRGVDHNPALRAELIKSMKEDEKGGNFVPIKFYEEDLDKGEPPRLVSEISTPEELARLKELHAKQERFLQDSNYDDLELKYAILDDLKKNPQLADLGPEIEEFRASLKTTEEKKRELEELQKDPEVQEAAATQLMVVHDSLQELIDDPGLVDAKEELIALQASLPQFDDVEDPAFRVAVAKLEEKLATNTYYQQQIAEGKEAERKRLQELGKSPDDIFDPERYDDEGVELDPLESIESFGREMRELLVSHGDDPESKALLARLDRELNNLPVRPDKDDDEDDLQFLDPEAYREELAKTRQLSSINEAESSGEESIDPELAKYDKLIRDPRLLQFETLADDISRLMGKSLPDDAEETVDPELEAKVDKIMDDPQLLDKLAVIKDIIDERKAADRDITQIAHPVAPDPKSLDESQLVTYKERLRIAESDPEHLAGIRRLRINLLPPFNVSPSLKMLNDALKLAYLGASDDVRRILWRSYSKARTLPTLIHNIPDDAWDMLWYSQAVTWDSNQNREMHLKILLNDLAAVGKDGPPTHPSTVQDVN